MHGTVWRREVGALTMGSHAGPNLPKLQPERLGGSARGLWGMSYLYVFGHSLATEGGATTADRDAMTHLASAGQMREVNRALGGAQLVLNNILSSAGTPHFSGGYAHLLQCVRRPGKEERRPYATLTSQATAGATSLSVTLPSGVVIGDFKDGDLLHIGTGDTGGTGGETGFITGQPSGTTINLRDATTRTHAAGDPVYWIPTDELPINALYLLYYGHNDYVFNLRNAVQTAYEQALRMIISRCRASEIYEHTHTSNVFTGSGTTLTNTRGYSSSDTTRNMIAGDTWTIHVSDNFPGGYVGVLFENTDTTVAGTISWTVDGAAQTTRTIHASPRAGRIVPMFFRVPLTAGRHKLVFTRDTSGASGIVTADCWWPEARLSPAILVPLMNRPWKYNNTDSTTGDNGGPTLNGHMRTTLQAQANVGAGTFTVNQATRADGTTQNRLFPTYPPTGTDVVIAPGTANEERFLTDAAVTGTDPYTISIDGTLANQHSAGTEVQFGISDAIVLHTINPAIKSVVNEFDTSVICVDVDKVFHGESPPPGSSTSNAMSTKNQTRLSYDYTHPSDEGHQKLGQTFWEALEQSSALTTEVISSMSVPSAPWPIEAVFISWANVGTTVYTGTTAQGLARTSGGTFFRVRKDVRRVVEWRAVAFVQTNATNVDARLRAEYSIDNGTTWVTLGRLQFTNNPPADADDIASDLLVGSNGGAANTFRINNPPYPGTSAWHRMPAEAITDDTQFRFKNVQGTTTGTQVLEYLALEFR